MIFTEGMMLGYYISTQRINEDPNKVEVIKQLPTPKNQNYIRIFMVHVEYHKSNVMHKEFWQIKINKIVVK